MTSLEELVSQERWEEATTQVYSTSSWQMLSNGFRQARRNQSAPCKFLDVLLEQMKFIAPSKRGTMIQSLSPRDSVDVYRAVFTHFGPPLPNNENSDSEWFLCEVIHKISRIWESFLLLEHSSRQVNESSKEQLLQVSSLSHLARFAEVQAVWTKTRHLLASAVAFTTNTISQLHDSSNKWLVVHTIAELGRPKLAGQTQPGHGGLPTVVMWLAMSLHPHQLKTRDQFGRIRLHIFASQPMNLPLSGVAFDGDTTVWGKSMLECVLSAFPDGINWPDGKSRLPLSLAAEHCPSQEVLDLMIRAAPEALLTRDPETRFWPFLHAAKADQSVDTIYSLLRLRPAVIDKRIQSALELAYDRLLLQRKTAEAEIEALRHELDEKNTQLAKKGTLIKEKNAEIRQLRQQMSRAGVPQRSSKRKRKPSGQDHP